MKISMPVLLVTFFSCFAYGDPDEIEIGHSFSELMIESIQSDDLERAEQAISSLKRSSEIPVEHLSGALLLSSGSPEITQQLLDAGAEPLVALNMLDARIQHTPEALECLVPVYHHVLSLFDLNEVLDAHRRIKEEIELMRLQESLSQSCPATLRERLSSRLRHAQTPLRRLYRAAPPSPPAAAAAMPSDDAGNAPRLRREDSRSPSPHVMASASPVSQ